MSQRVKRGKSFSLHERFTRHASPERERVNARGVWGIFFTRSTNDGRTRGTSVTGSVERGYRAVQPLPCPI